MIDASEIVNNLVAMLRDVPALVTEAGNDATRMLKLMEAVEDHDDVQNVWSNFDIDEKEIEASLA